MHISIIFSKHTYPPSFLERYQKVNVITLSVYTKLVLLYKSR